MYSRFLECAIYITSMKLVNACDLYLYTRCRNRSWNAGKITRHFEIDSGTEYSVLTS